MPTSHLVRAAILAAVVAAVVTVVLLKRPDAPPSPSVAAQAPRGPAPVAGSESPGSAESAPATAALPRLLELGSTTCIPCKQMVPVLDALRSEYGGKLTVEFVDVLADRAAGERYKVEVIPTQVFFDAEGKELGRHQGYWPKEEILGQFAAYGVKLEPASVKGAGR